MTDTTARSWNLYPEFPKQHGMGEKRKKKPTNNQPQKQKPKNLQSYYLQGNCNLRTVVIK